MLVLSSSQFDPNRTKLLQKIGGRSRSRRHVALGMSKLRYAALDDQFRSGHEGGIVARKEQRRLADFRGLAETMQRT
jgi:hypothetical protein